MPWFTLNRRNCPSSSNSPINWGLKVVLVVGPDEAAAGQVTIKNLLDGSQQAVARTEVVPAVRRILETG